MTKISNQRAYIPDEEINGLDYFVGTDFDNFLKTVNFRVGDLGTHYNQVNGLRNFDYNFYQHVGPTAKPADGYFYSNSNEKDPNNITHFIFSKKTARLKDVSQFFESISAENPFDLIISQKVDINTIFFFRITSIETFSGYYKLNVSEVFFPNGKELSYTLSYAVFNLKSEGIFIHNELEGLNDGNYIHLTAIEKEKFDNLPDTFATKTSDLTNDGSDGTSTYVETDELGSVAFSNNYNDLDNLPTIPVAVTKTSDLTNDGEDGVNPFITQSALDNNAYFVFELPHFFWNRYVSTNFSQPIATNGFLTFNVDSGTSNHLALVPSSHTAIYRTPRACVLDKVLFYGNISSCEIAIYKSPTLEGTSAIEIYNQIGGSGINQSNINSIIESDYFIHVFLRNLAGTVGTNSGRLFLKFK